MDAQGWRDTLTLEQMLAEADRRGIEVGSQSEMQDGRMQHRVIVALITKEHSVRSHGTGDSFAAAFATAWKSIPPTKEP